MALKEFVWTDESGTHSGSSFCVIAGYRASPGQWKKFDGEWSAVLGKYRITSFHSKEFFNRTQISNPKRNPYFKWSAKKADDFFSELLGVISHRAIYPVGCAVNVRDFEAYSYGERCVLAGYITKASRRKSRDPVPYHLAFRSTLVDAIATATPETKLHIIIAEQDEYQDRAGEEYTLTKQYSLNRSVEQLKSFGMRKPEDEPALQAADLLAGRWYNFLVRGRTRLNRENVTAMNILTHKRNAMPLCDRAAIERIFTEVGVSARDRKQLQAIQKPA